MSNRDGKRAKRKKGEKLSMAKFGQPCPRCVLRSNKHKKTNRKLVIDKDGFAKPVYIKKSRLVKPDCVSKDGHEHHVYCPVCHWTNY